MKILITGANGFIGKHLSKKLLSNGYKICTILRNESTAAEMKKRGINYFADRGNTEELIEYFKKEKFDGCIHLASCFIVEHKSAEITDLINSNLLFSTRVLEASVKADINWFINTGTFWQHYENKEYSPVNLYAATKQAFEAVIRYYLDISSINIVTLKLNDTYGPEDTRPKIFRLWRDIAESGDFMEMSPGEQLVDFLYVDDVIDAYIRMMEILKNEAAGNFRGKSYAVSSGSPVTLKELAELFSRVTKKSSI
ncbi:MAG: NAD-dependent epimerase/dehydratase family protein [Candidatus Omnitrophica bacterium]|nr:NAD-dependent epimerase/dehydratase family protein [Candidatus Omnitrophota bacterium]